MGGCGLSTDSIEVHTRRLSGLSTSPYPRGSGRERERKSVCAQECVCVTERGRSGP